jgi:hypothetical protein
MPLEPYYAALRHEASLLRPGIEQAEAQRTADMEDEVARCMSAAGFTYYPVETSEPALDESARALLEKEVGWLWDRLPVPQLGDTREDVAKHGYGQWEAFDLGLSGARLDDGAIALGEPGPDPNAEYTATLSEAAFNAYLKALEGVEPAGDGTWTGDGLAFSGEGDSCRAQAARKFPDPVLERPLSDYVYQDLVGGMAEISWQVDDDPSTLALDREWAACMLERGFDASEERGTGDGGVERISAGPVQAFQLAMRTGADGRVAAEYGDPDAPEDQRSLIQSGPEIEIALADFDCRVETDYMNRLIAIQTAMETAFVEENRSALDELLAAIEANIAVG